MPEALKCPRCGAVLPSEGWEGLCPKCIVRISIDTPADSEHSALRVPSSAFQKIRYFGDYELLEEIARGGMGIVYKARQRSLNRLVAVKMILAGEYASPEFVRRFRAEAEAAANLTHPNIVAIYEVGEHEGQQFFSMEYVEGDNLAEWSAKCKTRNKEWCRRAAQVVAMIAEAIHFAHQHGILHRDLKPSNILIDRFDQPRITDFGLAKRLDNAELGTRSAELTLTGQVLGSPNYMPPEQAEGKHRQATTASDIYSLGAILYHVLTGRPPFAAESVTDTLQKLLTTEAASPRNLNPDVSKDLETICLKCLEKDPRRRYATANELADELHHFLRDEPILARPVGPTGRLLRWCRRSPVLARVAGLSALLLLAIVIGLPLAADRVNQERHRAEQSAEAEARERKLFEESLDQLQFERTQEGVGFDDPPYALSRLVRVLWQHPTNHFAATWARTRLAAILNAQRSVNNPRFKNTRFLAQAESLSGHILAAVPDELDAWLTHADVLNRTGKPHEALATLTRALELWPDSPKILAATSQAKSESASSNTHLMRTTKIPQPPPSDLSLALGLIHWWRAENDAKDAVGGQDGTLRGGATFTAGKVGQAFRFDGMHDYVEVPDDESLDPGTNSFTIEAWIQTTNATDPQIVAQKNECGGVCSLNAGSVYGLYVWHGTAGGVFRSGGFEIKTAGQYIDGNRHVADGAWHHLVLLRDQTQRELRLYVDGTLETSSAIMPDAAGRIADDDGEMDPLLIGASVKGGETTRYQFFQGVIDEVKLYCRALSASEIRACYTTESGEIAKSRH